MHICHLLDYLSLLHMYLLHDEMSLPKYIGEKMYDDNWSLHVCQVMYKIRLNMNIYDHHSDLLTYMYNMLLYLATI